MSNVDGFTPYRFIYIIQAPTIKTRGKIMKKNPNLPPEKKGYPLVI